MTLSPPDRPPSDRECARAASPGLWRALAIAATALVSAIAMMLGGCASSAGIAPTAQALQPSRLGLDAAPSAPGVASNWWLAIGDPTLTALVERALAEQPTVRIAQARLERAQALRAGAQSAAGPQLNGAVDLTRERFSANGSVPPPLAGSTRTLASAQLSATWELDFFGRNRAAIDAALGGERAARADVQAARNLLATQVARTALQLARLEAQREVAAAALRQRESTLALIRDRVRGGLDSNVELRQGEGALPAARQQIEHIDEQLTLTRHALAVLTAQAPAATEALRMDLDRWHLPALPAVLPADLLGRRADVSAARWRVEASSDELRSAHAQFYPNVDLMAFAGLSAIGLDRLIDAGSRQIGAGPAIRLPIFDSGRLRANLRAKTADVDGAIESYNATVLDAVRDAADQLASLRSIARQQREQALARSAAESAYDLALQRYRAGLSPYLVVLNVEASVLDQRRLTVDLRAREVDAQLGLIRALGGGFDADATAVATRTESTP